MPEGVHVAHVDCTVAQDVCTRQVRRVTCWRGRGVGGTACKGAPGLLSLSSLAHTAHTPLAPLQDIKGYPTLKIHKDGASEGERYNGGRDLASLKAAVA